MHDAYRLGGRWEDIGFWTSKSLFNRAKQQIAFEGQNLEFKQRDVERQFVTDFMDVHRQIAEAGTDYKKLEAAVRAYWILMICEFYWWRRGLISRRLFLIWTEFREQEFRKNLPYFPAPTAAAGATPPQFNDCFGGFTYCKDHHVFRKGSHFVKFMNYLHSRSQGPERPLRWFQIERFRHRSVGEWF